MKYLHSALICAIGKRLLTTLAILAFFLPGLANANIVQNGNFAGGSGAGWTFNYGPINQGPAAPFNCGIDCGFLNKVVDGKSGWYDPWDLCQCTISQDLATTIGKTYLVSYVFGFQAGLDSGGYFDAWFDGVVGQHLGGILPPSATFDWQVATVSWLTTASSAVSTLEFGGLCPSCNFFVADVSVTVPSPATLPLLLVGGFSIFVLGRRSRQRTAEA